MMLFAKQEQRTGDLQRPDSIPQLNPFLYFHYLFYLDNTRILLIPVYLYLLILSLPPDRKMLDLILSTSPKITPGTVGLDTKTKVNRKL